MEGMARNDLDILRQKFLESLNLWVFAERLAADNGVLFGGCEPCSAEGSAAASSRESPRTLTVFFYHFFDSGRLHIVEDVITRSGYKVTVSQDLYIGLDGFPSALDQLVMTTARRSKYASRR